MLKNISKTVKSINKSDEGFTILEVIMAVSILTVGLLAVASLQVTAMRGNSMSMDYTESTEMVQDRVEKLLSLDFDHDLLKDINNNGIDGIDATGALADGNDLVTSDKYKVYWNVVDNWAGGAGGHEVLNVKTIRIIVKWTEKGRDMTYKFDLLRNRI